MASDCSASLNAGIVRDGKGRKEKVEIIQNPEYIDRPYKAPNTLYQ